MMDLESKLRETLERHSYVAGARAMPHGTVGRIRRRRVGTVALTGALTLAFLAAVVGLFRMASDRPSARPAAEATVAIPEPPGPGVTYVTPAPFADLGAGEWPAVDVGGVANPYVDRQTGEEDLLSDKVVVASGTVEGTEWSLTAFDAPSGDGGLGSGTCGELFLGDWGDYGGVRFCSNVRGETGQTDLRIAGTSFGMGPITSYAGVVSGDVERIVFEFGDGTSRTPDLVGGLPELDARLFVLFVPNDAAGRIVARGPDGEMIATEPLCVRAPAAQDEVASCGNGMEWTASAVAAEP